MTDPESRLKQLEEEIERRLVERFAALRDEFDRLRLESDRRWVGFLDRFDQRFTGIVPPELMPAAEPPPPTGKLPGGAISAGDVRSLDDAANQVEALHRFLDLCRCHASRVALLVARGGSIGVWKAVGFSEKGGSDEAARRAVPPFSPGSLLSRVMEGHPCELPADNEISGSLSALGVSRAVLVPMVVKEKISGALYADCVSSEEEEFDPEALGFLTFLAGLVVDRLAARKLKPAPALGPLEPVTVSAPAPAPAPPPEPEFELAEEPSALEPSASARPPETPPPMEPAAPPPPPPPSVPESAELAETPEPAGTVRIPGAMIEAAESAPPPPPEVVPVPPPAAPPRRPSTGARRLAGPLAAVEGDERRDEARRFAKLLVSEIKLYNEKAVQQGRKQGNIYELLKEDIDRSRQMYDERIPEDVRANSNYFYEELVRILAEGRPEALGL